MLSPSFAAKIEVRKHSHDLRDRTEPFRLRHSFLSEPLASGSTNFILKEREMADDRWRGDDWRRMDEDRFRFGGPGFGQGWQGYGQGMPGGMGYGPSGMGYGPIYGSGGMGYG